LYGSAELMGYGTHESVSYEVQPTSDHQEHAKRNYGGNQNFKRQQDMGYNWEDLSNDGCTAIVVRHSLQSIGYVRILVGGGA
jgi:hypothetical protein